MLPSLDYYQVKEEQGAIFSESVIMLMGRYIYASCILALESCFHNILCTYTCLSLFNQFLNYCLCFHCKRFSFNVLLRAWLNAEEIVLSKM